MKRDLKHYVLTAMFMALVCVATMSIRIPTPGTNGYIHPGDALVVLSGFFLGPVYGFLAGGIGSAMADLIGGYFLYVPITFLIKGMGALVAGYMFQKLGATTKGQHFSVILGGICNTILVVFGYFLYESVFYGIAGAAASIPANMIQGIGGLVIAMVLYPVLRAIPNISE